MQPASQNGMENLIQQPIIDLHLEPDPSSKIYLCNGGSLKIYKAAKSHNEASHHRLGLKLSHKYINHFFSHEKLVCKNRPDGREGNKDSNSQCCTIWLTPTLIFLAIMVWERAFPWKDMYHVVVLCKKQLVFRIVSSCHKLSWFVIDCSRWQ